MRAVLQRVSRAEVEIGGAVKSAIGPGLLVLVAFEAADTEGDLAWMSGKIVRLRVFNDDTGVMNRSARETGAELLVVSQFTLFASTKKGNRPSYVRSAPPEMARPLYERFLARLAADLGRPVGCGEFGADMRVELVNDGPVTICMDSRARE